MRSCLPECQTRCRKEAQKNAWDGSADLVCSARSTTKGCAQKAIACVASLARDRTLASDLFKRSASFKNSMNSPWTHHTPDSSTWCGMRQQHMGAMHTPASRHCAFLHRARLCASEPLHVRHRHSTAPAAPCTHCLRMQALPQPTRPEKTNLHAPWRAQAHGVRDL